MSAHTVLPEKTAPKPELLDIAVERVRVLRKEREELMARINQIDSESKTLESNRQVAVTRIVGVLASLQELEALCGMPKSQATS